MELYIIVFWIAAIIVSIAMIIIFFGMASHIKSIRNAIDIKSPQYWEDEYKKALFMGKKEELEHILYNHMYYYIMSRDNAIRGTTYAEYKKYNEDKFNNSSISFPEWNEDIFREK